MKVLIFLLMVAVCRGAVYKHIDSYPARDVPDKQPGEEQPEPNTELKREEQIRLIKRLKDVERKNDRRNFLDAEEPKTKFDPKDKLEESEKKVQSELNGIPETRENLKRFEKEWQQRKTDHQDREKIDMQPSKKRQEDAQKVPMEERPSLKRVEDELSKDYREMPKEKFQSSVEDIQEPKDHKPLEKKSKVEKTKIDITRREPFGEKVETKFALEREGVQKPNQEQKVHKNLFPAGEMMMDMLLEPYHWYKEIADKDVKNFSGMNETFLDEVVKSIPKVTRELTDPMTLTVLYFKDIIEEVMKERLRCPSVVLDKVLLRIAKIDLEVVRVEFNHIMSSYLEMLLSGYLNRTERQHIVDKSSDQLNKEEYYQIMHYIVGGHLRDVYHLAQDLFPQLHTFFTNYMNNRVHTNVGDICTIVKRAVKRCNVTCPVGTSLLNDNKYVLWDMEHQFGLLQASAITFHIEDLIFREVFYMYAKKGEAFPEGLFHLARKMHLNTLEKINEFISFVDKSIVNYERLLFTKDVGKYLNNVGRVVFDENEKRVITKVLMSLGWRIIPDYSLPAYQHEIGDARVYDL